MYKSHLKRFLDFSISFIALALLLPIFALVTFSLFLANQGNPFFVQKRPGKDEQIFNILKFKTMTDQKDAHGNLLPDNERLTTIGSLIRKTSLDEIPQLINVLKGDMSLIGPRPLLIQYLPLYNPEQKRRHHVRPGITGWAQVNGRNAINWKQKFAYDIWYVDHISFVLDVKILILTVLKVIKRDGITQTGHVTMDFFRGNDD